VKTSSLWPHCAMSVCTWKYETPGLWHFFKTAESDWSAFSFETHIMVMWHFLSGHVLVCYVLCTKGSFSLGTGWLAALDISFVISSTWVTHSHAAPVRHAASNTCDTATLLNITQLFTRVKGKINKKSTLPSHLTVQLTRSLKAQ
jgi:hypothetical protein